MLLKANYLAYYMIYLVIRNNYIIHNDFLWGKNNIAKKKDIDITGTQAHSKECIQLLDCVKVFNYTLHVKSYSFTGGARFLTITRHTYSLTHTHSQWVVVTFLICALSPEGRRRWFNPIYTPLRPKMNTTWLHPKRCAQVSRSGVYDLSPNEGPGHDPDRGQGSASKP